MKKLPYVAFAFAAVVILNAPAMAQSNGPDSSQNKSGSVGTKTTPAGTVGQAAQSNAPSSAAAQGAGNAASTTGAHTQPNSPTPGGSNIAAGAVTPGTSGGDSVIAGGGATTPLTRDKGENAPGGSSDYDNHPNDHNNSGNWGLLGLLGLFGLIGYTMRADLRKPQR